MTTKTRDESELMAATPPADEQNGDGAEAPRPRRYRTPEEREQDAIEQIEAALEDLPVRALVALRKRLMANLPLSAVLFQIHSRTIIRVEQPDPQETARLAALMAAGRGGCIEAESTGAEL